MTTYIVKRTPLADCPVATLSVWERTTAANNHGTTHSFPRDGGGWKLWGRLGTNWLTPELEAMPMGAPERQTAVWDYFQGLYAKAYRVILAAYPELNDPNVCQVRDLGTIEIPGRHPAEVKTVELAD